MSAVDFHTHLADPLQYACRLLRKVYHSGGWARVHCAPHGLARLNAALWTFSPLEFVAHATDASPQSVMRRSPILLTASDKLQTLPGLKDRDVLVNLGANFDPTAQWVASYRKVIELVGHDEPSLALARTRFKAYRTAQPAHQLSNYDQRAAQG